MVTAEKENTESVFTYTASGQRYTKAVTTAGTAEDAASSVNTAATANAVNVPTSNTVPIQNFGLRLDAATLPTQETTITRYVYDGYGVLFETDLSGTVTALNHRGTNLYARTSYGASANVEDVNGTSASGTGNITAYYLCNAHGDVEELIDAASGTTLASYTYDAFGTQLKAEETDTFKNTVTYRGYEFDSDTGLYYLNARYYDSETARFLTEDTYRGEKDDPLSLNLYAYCAGNPVKYADPSGNIIITATAAVTMLVISALTCGLVGEIACVFDQCYTEDGWDFSDYDIDKTATALVTSGTRGAADCAIAFCAGGIAIKVGQELATELGVQAGTRLFAAVSSGFAGAFTGSVSGAGARMAEALTYNAVCDLIGCPEYKMSFVDRIAYSWNPDAICMDALLGFCSYAANAAYSFKPAYNQGICVSEGAHCYDNSGSAAETTVNSGTVADGKIPADAAVTGQGSNGQTIGKQKTGPKPQGTGPHNVKIEEVASQIKDGEVIAGGGKFKEKAIPTVNGVKSSRRPDILVKKPDGSMYGINVGKTTAKGAPIKREVEAIYDLEGAGLPMYFVAYDK